MAEVEPVNIRQFAVQYHFTQETEMPSKNIDLTHPKKLAFARLEARISQDLHSIVKRAAEIQGRTMTDFVVLALEVAASQVIERSEHVRLSVVDQEAFANALIEPPKPNAALKRAIAKADKLLVS